MVKGVGRIRSVKKLIVLIVVSVVLIGNGQALAQTESSKFIVIHLDGISREDFLIEMEAGNLPNLERTFKNEGLIEHAITYFPGMTQIVIPRIREARSSSQGRPVDWGGYKRDEEKTRSKRQVFFDMGSSMSRRGRSNLIYGVPLLDQLAGPALVNLADLVDDYDTLEFYWFSTDTYGHTFGQEALYGKLRKFDKYFGKLADRLDEDVNIVIYSDHGMTFGEGVNPKDDVKEIVGDDLIKYSYPNLYLSATENKDNLAQRLIAETEINYTFLRANDQQIIGYHNQGQVSFKKRDGAIKYDYQGQDPFGYYKQGYTGQYLTTDQWLELTYDLEYPLTPVNIYTFLKNPKVGEILTVVDDEKFIAEGYVRKGNHSGMTATDLTVPLFLKGPNLEHLYERDYIWLPKLFAEIEDVNFDNPEPEREKNYLSYWHSFEGEGSQGTKISLSPAYRWRLGARITEQDQHQAWAKYDLFSSYLSRLWVGGGVDVVDSEADPTGKLRYDLRYKNLLTSYVNSSREDARFKLGYQLNSDLTLQVVDFETIGTRIEW
ncbi:alkaline phosphatase family protein [Natroniella acetigena]|uniref:alkaline phosphatase family protein n=1 Tax=Natroniella acetigena TaxID=52004 RepID=UPI00200B2728|nr:alkaline phosphatase family protein [Natroniella acetigena]MCK8827520.1 alkaline phosphatase family protein [Natroniella acetigena]